MYLELYSNHIIKTVLKAESVKASIIASTHLMPPITDCSGGKYSTKLAGEWSESLAKMGFGSTSRTVRGCLLFKRQEYDNLSIENKEWLRENHVVDGYVSVKKSRIN